MSLYTVASCMILSVTDLDQAVRSEENIDYSRPQPESTSGKQWTLHTKCGKDHQIYNLNLRLHNFFCRSRYRTCDQ